MYHEDLRIKTVWYWKTLIECPEADPKTREFSVCWVAAQAGKIINIQQQQWGDMITWGRSWGSPHSFHQNKFQGHQIIKSKK